LIPNRKKKKITTSVRAIMIVTHFIGISFWVRVFSATAAPFWPPNNSLRLT
jgi:ribosomal protein S19